MTEIKTCSCGKKIAMLPTAKGKRAPVVFDTLSQEDREKINDITFTYGKHTNHFSDCPDSSKYRFKGKSAT